MKNIIKSLVVVVAVAAVASVATYAYFIDQAVVAGNTYSAGTLDFTLNGEMTESQHVTLANLEPGADWTGPYRMKVYNKNTPLSTVDMKYKFYDRKISESVAGFYNKLNAKVVHGYCINDAPNGDVNPTYTWTGRLADLNYVSTDHSIGGGKLEPNISHCFALYFQLDSTAGNSMQGANAVADIVVDGTQFINPGWTQ